MISCIGYIKVRRCIDKEIVKMSATFWLSLLDSLSSSRVILFLTLVFFDKKWSYRFAKFSNILYVS